MQRKTGKYGQLLINNGGLFCTPEFNSGVHYHMHSALWGTCKRGPQCLILSCHFFFFFQKEERDKLQPEELYNGTVERI